MNWMTSAKKRISKRKTSSTASDPLDPAMSVSGGHSQGRVRAASRNSGIHTAATAASSKPSSSRDVVFLRKAMQAGNKSQAIPSKQHSPQPQYKHTEQQQNRPNATQSRDHILDDLELTSGVDEQIDHRKFSDGQRPRSVSPSHLTNPPIEPAMRLLTAGSRLTEEIRQQLAHQLLRRVDYREDAPALEAHLLSYLNVPGYLATLMSEYSSALNIDTVMLELYRLRHREQDLTTQASIDHAITALEQTLETSVSSHDRRNRSHPAVDTYGPHEAFSLFSPQTARSAIEEMNPTNGLNVQLKPTNGLNVQMTPTEYQSVASTSVHQSQKPASLTSTTSLLNAALATTTSSAAGRLLPPGVGIEDGFVLRFDDIEDRDHNRNPMVQAQARSQFPFLPSPQGANILLPPYNVDVSNAHDGISHKGQPKTAEPHLNCDFQQPTACETSDATPIWAIWSGTSAAANDCNAPTTGTACGNIRSAQNIPSAPLDHLSLFGGQLQVGLNGELPESSLNKPPRAISSAVKLNLTDTTITADSYSVAALTTPSVRTKTSRSND